jgi:hypothetical protein
MKQTSVEWLENNIQSDMTFIEIMALIRQAKEMDNNQIKADIIDWKILEAREWAIGHKTMSRKLKNNLITNFNGVLLGDIQEGDFLKYSRVGYKSWQEFFDLTRCLD